MEEEERKKKIVELIEEAYVEIWKLKIEDMEGEDEETKWLRWGKFLILRKVLRDTLLELNLMFFTADIRRKK